MILVTAGFGNQGKLAHTETARCRAAGPSLRPVESNPQNRCAP